MRDPKILVVDDDPDLRMFLKAAFRREGYEVDEADRGGSAQEVMRAKAPDVVLLDLYLPDMTGFDVLEWVAKSHPAAKVVIMTGHGEIATAVRAMKLGALDYLIKPVDPVQLRATIDALLTGTPETKPDRLARPIIGDSPQMLETWRQVSLYALPDVSISLCGESGTGKELFAQAIHQKSKRRTKPFVALDCATLPDTLVESEIFGHEKGAFTGAFERRIGKFESAHTGCPLHASL